MSRPKDSDECWLLLMELYLRKPVGVKPPYSRAMVSLALELHVAPQELYAQSRKLARIDDRRLGRLWATYSKSPRKLKRAVGLLRSLRGYGQADEFYEGVTVNESFERDFKPVDGESGLTPLMLILVLDLYFRLTPSVMVASTPEVVELARLMGVGTGLVVEVLEAYQSVDPYLRRSPMEGVPYMDAVRQVWNRFGNDSPEKLAALAAQMKEYFRS